LKLNEKKVGFVITGSFCTFKKIIDQLKKLVKEEADIIPIMSYNSYNMDTKFGKAQEFINEIEEITGKKILHELKEVEPIGPKQMTDIMIVAPATRKYNRKIST